MLPMTKEVFNYEMNWVVVDKYEMHEKMRPWISNIAKNSTEEEADDFVSDILESTKNDGSALSIHTKIMSFILVNEVETERLFPKIWAMLKKLEEEACSWGREYQWHTYKAITKETLLSLEINWAVFDQHELHETMKLRIKNEVMKLLKKEKASVVDQVIDGIKKQNRPSQMLELLEPSLDVYTEMVVRILWRTLLILVKIFETGVSSIFLFTSYLNMLSISKTLVFSKFGTGFAAFPESISSANPTSELSNMEGKNFMPSKDNLRQQDPVWNNKERNRLANAIPRNLESVSSYVVDWAVSDKEELHKKLRPWIFREIREFVRQEEAATGVVNNIVSRIQEHASAKDILELVKPSLGNGSANFVLHLWTKLPFFIQLAGTTGLDPFTAIDRERSAGESLKISQYGDRYSRNRHFMMVAFDYENLLKLKRVSEAMPKTKEELFSYEIFTKSMRKGIWIETLELIRKRKESMLVDEQIMWSIFDYHVSASQRELSAQEEAILVFEEIMSSLHKDRACPSEMVKYLEPIFCSGSEKFVMRMWYALICGVKLAEARVEKKCKRGWGSIVLLPAEGEDKDL
ncbi:hypothetical protein MKW98_019870 [Papaver atlanticum]|uniref:Uncharacterized protein n=1 Tax=Papaver atlanticum TaxID=357466 RepID=A0AAD4S0M9_9MAGN|nr:hypothetical protein MKW98_019870 [Papaver atlanticum]